MEFWNSDITNESWRDLSVLSTKYNFILIGGWAIYTYTKLQKSRDIDMVVDYDQFKLLSVDFEMRKIHRCINTKSNFKSLTSMSIPHFFQN